MMATLNGNLEISIMFFTVPNFVAPLTLKSSSLKSAPLRKLLRKCFFKTLNNFHVPGLLLPLGFGPEAKTRGVPAYSTRIQGKYRFAHNRRASG